MPDLRDELGRLADFVGEPVGLDDLAAARRRRGRRRRAGGLVGGLAVLLIGALIAVRLSTGASPVTVPGDTNTPAPMPAATATVWPENAVNGDSWANVQASLDGGDDTLRWRTDPGRVVERFGQAVLGRAMRVLSVDTEGVDALVRAFPCPPGEQAIGLSCDVTPGDPITFRLVQPGTRGTNGIWSVASVTSPPLGIKGLPDVGSTVSEGAEIPFDVFMFENPTAAHLGIVVSNGCNVVHATKDVTVDGRTTLRVPSVGDAAPSCAADPTGYAYAYVTDDTTLPSTDPINDPTAIEYPWITIVPIAVDSEGEVVSPTPESSADESAPSGVDPDGVLIPIAVDSPTAEGCPTVPATEFDMTLQNLHLVGCGRWSTGAEITIHFTIADSGVPAGLLLFRDDQCAGGVCTGQPSLNTKVDIESRTVRFGPVDAGGYILLDPVHPMTSAVAIDVG
jgi:hypothetical protein